MNCRIVTGDCLDFLSTLPSESARCIVTSPPYWGLRDYGAEGQVGLEATPEEYVEKLVRVFREAHRVLAEDGTLWLNLGDSYAGSWGARGRSDGTNAPRPDLEGKYGTTAPNRHGYASWGVKPKDLMGMPWRVAFALQADGWYLRSDIIWAKPNPMPESVTDRPTKAHEYLFLLSKSERYYYDHKAIKEPTSRPELVGRRNGHMGNTIKGDPTRPDGRRPSGAAITHRDDRNKRTVWTVPTRPYPEAHFATYPPELIAPCILAGSQPGDTVLDPFNGSGTTGQVALELGRSYIGIELNPGYVRLTEKRLAPLINQPRLLETA